MGRCLLMLLWLFGSIWTAQPATYAIGDKLTVQCNESQIPFKMEPMRVFSIALIGGNIPKNVELVLSSGKESCSMNHFSTVCTFRDRQNAVNIKCTNNFEFVFKVVDPEQLEDQDKNKAEFVEVQLQSQGSGILFVNGSQQIGRKIRDFKEQSSVLSLFTYSACVQNVALFEDHIVIALKYTSSDPCVVGLRDGTKENWNYIESRTDLTDKSTEYYGYISKTDSMTYTLAQEPRTILELVVDSDIVDELSSLSVTLTFDGKDGSYEYTLNNFLNGMYPFLSVVEHPLPASKLTVKTNTNMFFTIRLLTRNIVHSERYVHTKVQDKYQFVYVVYNVDDILRSNLSLEIVAPSKLKQFSLEYGQCSDYNCTNVNTTNMTDMKFQPPCSKDTKQCVVLIRLVRDSKSGNTTVAFLPVALLVNLPVVFEPLELNKIHEGYAENGAVGKFVVKKEELQTVQDEIGIEMEGVFGCVTYDSTCQRIWCCQYDLGLGSNQIPNQKKDLYIFVMGNSDKLFTIMANSKDESYIVPHGKLVTLHTDRPHIMYTYSISKGTKDISIHCNGKVRIYININSTEFPTVDDYEYETARCQLTIPEDELPANRNSIHILVVNSGTDFSFIIYDSDTIMDIPYSKLFRHKLPGNGIHIYRLPVVMDQFRDIAIKIDNLRHSNHTIELRVGSKSYKDYDFQMIPIKKDDLKDDCKGHNVCELTVQLKANSKEALLYSILLWKREKPIELVDGQPMKFNTGGFGAEAYFYYKVQQATKSLNIYVSSNEAKVSVQWELVSVSQADNHPEMLTYPELKKQEVPETYSTHIFINSTHLSQTAESKKIRYIVITVKDKADKTSSGHMVLTAVSDIVYVSDQSRMEFSLQAAETMIFQYDVELLLSANTTKQDIYFYLNNVNNKAQAYYEYVLDGRVVHHTQNTTENFYVIPIEEVKKYFNRTESKQQIIKFIVSNTDKTKTGTFVADIVLSNLDFRKLTLGYPSQFFIKKNSSLVFEYSNIYNEDFKFKIFRDKGMPSFRVRSCQKTSKDCLQEIQASNKKADPKYLISYARSHELDIDHNNAQFCKNCRYYLVFYSHGEDIRGAVSVTSYFSPTYLSTSMPITTEAYTRLPDSYRFTIPAHEQRTLSMVCHTNRIKVFMYSVDINGKLEGQAQSETVVAPGTPIDIELESMSKAITRQISVEVINGVSASYTVILLDEKSEIKLTDGVLLNFNREADDRTLFEYACHEKTNLLVVSSDALEVDIGCIEKIQKKKLLVEVQPSVSATPPEIVSNKKSQSNEADAQSRQAISAAGTDTKTQGKTQNKTETKVDNKTDTKADSKTDNKPEDKPRIKPQSNSEQKNTDSKTENKQDNRKDNQAENKLQSTKDNIASVKLQDPKPVSQPETKKEAKPDTKPTEVEKKVTKTSSKAQTTDKKLDTPNSDDQDSDEVQDKPKHQQSKKQSKGKQPKTVVGKDASEVSEKPATSKKQSKTVKVEEPKAVLKKQSTKKPEEKSEQKSGQKQDSIVAERLRNTVVMEHNIINSLTKTRTFVLESSTCVKYKITIKNDKPANFSIMATGSNIIMMPLNMTMPGRLQKGEANIYEVTFNYKSKIKVVLRTCVNGQMRVGLSHDHSEMLESKFSEEFQTNGVQHHYSSTYTVPPGVTFITVKSLSNTVEYTLEVYHMDGTQDKSDTIAHMEASNYQVTYLGVYEEEDEDPVDSYSIVFPGLNIEDPKTIYNISYAVIESPNKTAIEKFVKCRGAFVDRTDSKQLITRMMDDVETVNEFKRRINYTTEEDVYISIVPVVNPALPGYVAMEPYKVVKLTNSRGIFGWLYVFHANVHGVLKQTLDMDEGMLLSLLSLTLTVFLFATFTVFIVFTINCIRYGVRLNRYQMVRAYVPSEYELRHQRHLEHSLDMIEQEPPEQKRLELRYSGGSASEQASNSL